MAPHDETVSDWEAEVQAHPEDLRTRAALLRFYYRTSSPKFAPALFWLIENHPESWAAISATPERNDDHVFSAREKQHAAELWELQLANHPDSPAVLLNGARFFSSSDPDRALELLEQARKLDPSNRDYTTFVAAMYEKEMEGHARGTAESGFTATSANALKAILIKSNDPQLLGYTGIALAHFASLEEAGLELVQRAASIDPTNPEWTAALRNAVNPPSMPNAPITISAEAANANLINKVEPRYPPLAKTALIEGPVEFKIMIGETGVVQSIGLVRGNPLLVNAAKEAVMQWKYKPTLVNGYPIPVITDVAVNFSLSRP